MNKEVDNIKKTRIFLLNAISDLSVEQLNEIPPGFNNNIIWNLAHLIAAQQGVCYMRSGASIVVEEKYFLQYRPGTKPEQFVDEEEVQKIKGLSISTLEQLAVDLTTNAFDKYKTWTTRYGAELASINDAVQFLPYHEGLHTGIIMALKKLVSK